MKNKLIFFSMILLGIFSLVGRVWWGSVNELIKSEYAMGKKDYSKAVIHYEKAILWNFPFLDHKDKAIKGIQSIKEWAQVENGQIVERYAEDSLAFALTSLGNSPEPKNNSFNTPTPSRFWSAMVGLSLLTWIGITFLFITSCFERNFHIINKKRFTLIFFLLGIVIFLWIFSINRL